MNKQAKNDILDIKEKMKEMKFGYPNFDGTKTEKYESLSDIDKEKFDRAFMLICELSYNNQSV